MKGMWRGRGLISVASASTSFDSVKDKGKRRKNMMGREAREGLTRAKQYPHGLIAKNNRIAKR